jgi:oligopeptide transport system substrate-binding protein
MLGLSMKTALLTTALAIAGGMIATPVLAEVVYNRGNDTDPETLDHHKTTTVVVGHLMRDLYEGLVIHDAEAEVVPGVAESWEISDDGLIYTFNIRENANWSNGDPVTAHDFVYSFQRLLLPDTASYYSSMLFVIEGARKFFEWRTEQLAFFASSANTESAHDLWHKTQQQFHDTVGVRAVTDHTLEITLERPVPYFTDLIALAVCSPVHRPTVEGWQVDEAMRLQMRENGWHSVDAPSFAQRRWMALNESTGRIEQKHDWCKPEHLVTNGPYVLARWRFKRDMLMVKNPHYHRPEIMRNESVLLVNIEDANTAILAYESGRFDWLSDVGAEYRADMLAERQAYEAHHADTIARLLREGRDIDEAFAALPEPQRGERRNIHAFPAFGVDFYQFNCRPTLANGRSNPFADAAVRRAFVLATDREVITRQVTRLNEPVMTTLIPPGSIPGYNSPEGLGYDPQRARRELAEAGWIDREGDGMLRNEAGEPFPVVEILWTTNTPRYRWISLELKSQWERKLGVRVELRGVDTRFYRDDLRTGNFMVARGTWYGDYGDPTTFLNLCRSDDGNNHRRYASEYVDDLLDQAAAERDPEARMRILERAEAHIFQNDVPMMPICQLMQVYMYEPGEFRGLSRHPRLVQYLWQLEASNR